MDAHASTYDFPILDNAHWRLICARMRGFRRADAVALVFEIFVYHVQAQAFLVNVYAFGDLPAVEPANCGAYSPINELPDWPLWNDAGEWAWSARAWSVSVNGTEVTVDTTRSTRPLDDERVTLSHGDTVDEISFALAMTRELGVHRLLPDEAILDALPELTDSVEVIRLSNWDHPDVLGGQQPSDSLAIREVAALLVGDSDRVTYDHGADNVDGRSWLT